MLQLSKCSWSLYNIVFHLYRIHFSDCTYVLLDRISKGQVKTVKYLVSEAGCDKECTNSRGRTPLRHAAM